MSHGLFISFLIFGFLKLIVLPFLGLKIAIINLTLQGPTANGDINYRGSGGRIFGSSPKLFSEGGRVKIFI